jgi:hypothetical protein
MVFVEKGDNNEGSNWVKDNCVPRHLRVTPHGLLLGGAAKLLKSSLRGSPAGTRMLQTARSLWLRTQAIGRRR